MNNDEHASRNSLPSQADVATDVEAAADADNRVGYRRPPRHSRFQPGRSGNPRGRPLGVKSLSDIVRKIVGQKVTVTENGRARRVPRLEAILLRAAGTSRVIYAFPWDLRTAFSAELVHANAHFAGSPAVHEVIGTRFRRSWRNSKAATLDEWTKVCLGALVLQPLTEGNRIHYCTINWKLGPIERVARC
jgi:hypothetical protein